MQHSPRDESKVASSSALSGQWRFLDLLHGASARLLTVTAITVAVAWVPLAIFCVVRGGATFVSFLTDYAIQSRFLVILPVLMLAAPNLNGRLEMVARHFEPFVPQNQISRFQASWTSFERLRNSRLAQGVMVLLTYAIAAWLAQYLSPQGTEIMPWTKGGGGFRWMSLAGTYAVFVSYPILAYLGFLWLWRQLLWTRFMRSAARLNLRVIAAHPDRLAGLAFLEASLRGQMPFSFCLGAGLAGAVANRVFHHGQKLTNFNYAAGALVGAVLLICIVPYFVFTPVLMQIRRRGLLRYGAFARAMGEQFEKKWLDQPDNVNQDVLTVPDFSATTDLYSVVSIVNDIRVLPVGLVDLYILMVVAFIPVIPVVLGAIPFDIVARAAVKLLF